MNGSGDNAGDAPAPTEGTASTEGPTPTQARRGAQAEAGAGSADAGPETERRQRLHEANNRLAAVIMNLAFARATLGACPPEAQLTELERADLGIALEHAEDAANRLAIVIRELG